MKHIDLFSGIGGFALAADRVFGDVEHIFCDNNPFSQLIIKKHWPEAKIYGDIRTLTADTYWERYVHGKPEKQPAKESHKAQRKSVAGARASILPTIDILTGGFPCQPFSQAGKRRGTADDRHLWPEMLRVIREFNPRWVIGENVGGLVTWDGGMVLEQVHLDLEAAGYEVQAFIIPAVAKNAPHRRDRVWIVANSCGQRLQRDEQQGTYRTRIKERKEGAHGTAAERNNDASNTESVDEKWPNAKRNLGRRSKGKNRNTDWDAGWLEVASRLCRVDDGIPKRLDRSPRLKALGNAIVPQVAEEIMRAILTINSSNK